MHTVMWTFKVPTGTTKQSWSTPSRPRLIRIRVSPASSENTTASHRMGRRSSASTFVEQGRGRRALHFRVDGHGD
jgi:hypothetical protein